MGWGDRAGNGMGPAQAQACESLWRSRQAEKAATGVQRRASRCPHGIERASCRMCGGRRMCVHLIQRKFCQQCAGTQVCEHGRNRCVCMECGGNRVCRTCRGRVVLKRDTECALCQHAKEWEAWMKDQAEGRRSRGKDI